MLHGLHPDDIETRVQQALGKMHGNAELIGVFEGVVRVRLTGSGCGLEAIRGSGDPRGRSRRRGNRDRGKRSVRTASFRSASLGNRSLRGPLDMTQAPVAALRKYVRPRESGRALRYLRRGAGRANMPHTSTRRRAASVVPATLAPTLYGSVYRPIPRRVRALPDFKSPMRNGTI